MKMLRSVILSAALALTGGAAMAAIVVEVEDYNFSYEGPFGSYDQMQLQRGLQIYTQVCAACHGLKFVAFRTLADEGGPMLPEDQMRAYTEAFEVWDPKLEDGFGDFRTATPVDRFPPSSMAIAPDLSLMAKARAGFSGPYGTGLNQLFRGMGGPEYIASLLAGYAEEPACALEGEPMDGYYNMVFPSGGYPSSCYDEAGNRTVPGSWIGMPQPLYGEDIDFADGAPNDIKSEAADIAAFLMWTAEPHLNSRKQAGLTGVIFLSVLAVLLYLTNKRLWARVKHPDQVG